MKESNVLNRPRDALAGVPSGRSFHPFSLRPERFAEILAGVAAAGGLAKFLARRVRHELDRICDCPEDGSITEVLDDKGAWVELREN